MGFFNQLEKNYLSDFIKEHRPASQTYFKSFTRLELAEFIEEKTSNNSYFFMRGITALFNAGVSAGKGIYSLLSFSFKDTKLAGLETGNLLVSGLTKIGFSAVATCLNIVQFIGRTISTCSHLLKSTCNIYHAKSQEDQKLEKEKNALEMDMSEMERKKFL